MSDKSTVQKAVHIGDIPVSLLTRGCFLYVLTLRCKVD